jgi:hypothetical protein
MNQLPIDPKELIPAGIGFCIGLCILAFFIVLGLSIGLTASIDFGIPHQ